MLHKIRSVLMNPIQYSSGSKWKDMNGYWREGFIDGSSKIFTILEPFD
jgi:hypothetical protein